MKCNPIIGFVLSIFGELHNSTGSRPRSNPVQQPQPLQATITTSPPEAFPSYPPKPVFQPPNYHRKQFGCDFLSHSNGYYETKTKYLLQPEWGTDVKTMKFRNQENFNDFFEVLNEVYQEVVQEYDTMTPFFKFQEKLEEYEKQRKVNYDTNHNEVEIFKEFYRQYRPNFMDAQGTSSGLIVKLLSKLEQKWPDTKDHTYMSPCAVVVTGESHKTFHGEVAGFIKIKINGRPGLILMEPGFGFETPVVLMDDGNLPHADTSVTSVEEARGHRYTFRMAGAGRPYIVATRKEDKYNSNKILATRLYPVERPYCSILQTSVKPALLSGVYEIGARREKHRLRASLRADIYSKFLYHGLIESYSYDLTKRSRIYYPLDRSVASLFEKVIDVLRMPESTAVELIKRLANIVYKFTLQNQMSAIKLELRVKKFPGSKNIFGNDGIWIYERDYPGEKDLEFFRFIVDYLNNGRMYNFLQDDDDDDYMDQVLRQRP